MSSETSTDTLQPWQLFTLAGLIGATVVVFVSSGETPAGIILLSFTIFAAAAVGLAAWRTFGPLAEREGVRSMIPVTGGRTRAALEREKTLALRAIKDLEFDWAMGKVSEKDFAEMSARLRLRASGLIRQLDAGAGHRDEIEREIARRIGREEQTRSADRTAAGAGPPGAPAASLTCAACATINDGDARFCKGCGASLAGQG